MKTIIFDTKANWPYKNSTSIDAGAVCANIQDDQRKAWESQLQQQQKSLSLVSKELKDKGKASGVFASGIFNARDGDMSPKEMCNEVANFERDESKHNDCPGVDSVMKSMKSSSVESMSFDEACKNSAKFYERMISALKDCEEKASAKADRREPPGEEIAPAGDPAPKGPVVKTGGGNHFKAPSIKITPQKRKGPGATRQ